MAIGDLQGDINQLKRKQAGSGLPTGIGLTPEQQKVNADVEWRRNSIQRQQQFKQGISDSVGGIGDAIGQAARTVTATAGAGLDALRNTTFDSNLPDWRSESQRELDGRPTPQAQAGAVRAYDMAQRATDAGIAYAKEMRAMPRPSAPIPDTLKAPSGGAVAAGSAGAATYGGAPGGQPALASPAQSGGLAGWGDTGIGVGARGGEIVGLVNPLGIAEFSNRTPDQTAASGRQFSAEGLRPQRGNVPLSQPAGIGLPSGARALASGSSVPSGGEEFARLGSAANVGNGIGGGISYGQDGDAQAAIARFERANAERSRAIGLDGGLRVSGLGSKLTADDILQAKLGLRLRDASRADRQLQQQGLNADLDRSLRERELTSKERRAGIEDQVAKQGIEKGEMDLAQQRQVADLYARYQQAAPEDKPGLAEQIRTLTGREAPNRFTVVAGGQEYDPKAMAMVNRPSRVLNNQTGQFVDGQQPQQDSSPTPPQNHINALKNNPQQADMFDAIYGKGAAARYLGAK